MKAAMPSTISSETLLEKNNDYEIDYKNVSDEEILILDALDLKIKLMKWD